MQGIQKELSAVDLVMGSRNHINNINKEIIEMLLYDFFSFFDKIKSGDAFE